jgi:hypothetical protein
MKSQIDGHDSEKSVYRSGMYVKMFTESKSGSMEK